MKYSNIALIIVICLLGVTVQNGMAQQMDDDLEIGFRVGASVTDLSGSNIDGDRAYIPPAGGVYFNYQFSENLSVQPEVNIYSVGANFDLTLNGWPYKSAKVTYIQIPALLKGNIGTMGGGSIEPFVFAGPAFDVMVYKKVPGRILEDTKTGAYSINQRAEQTAFDAIVGIGGTINDLYVVDLRVNYGLTDTFEDISDVSSRSVTLSFGFKF